VGRFQKVVATLEGLMRTISRMFVPVAVAALAALAVAGGPTAASAAAPATIYVNSARGADSGPGTQADPLRTIQQAMNRAGPGTVIHLAAGGYDENVTTRTSGRPGARITVEGPASGTATLYGTVRAMDIRNSYYTLADFSIDGQQKIEARYPVSTWPTTTARVGAFDATVAPLAVNDRLVYIDSGSATTGVTGTIIEKMTLTGAGGECVRIRNNATGNVVQNSVIRYCGMYPVPQPGQYTYHNGEGVYIGTSPKTTGLVNSRDDQSSGNLVANDTITTYGTECFDVKENAHSNTLTDSRCMDNTEPSRYQGSNVELRGYANTVSGNQVSTSLGYGLKIASDTRAEDLNRNIITDNTFASQPAGALHDRSRAPAGQVCGNAVGAGSTLGDFSELPGWSARCRG
jgi:Protein of unknown function (DUF1565)